MRMKEQNKWIKWILIAIVLLSLAAPVTSIQSPALTITDYIVQPEILTPGELGTVTVTLKNSAVNASADITDIYLFAPRFEHDHKRFEQVGILGGGAVPQSHSPLPLLKRKGFTSRKSISFTDRKEVLHGILFVIPSLCASTNGHH
uniref:CARDB domain-containing protein n=1 Tax=Candidatus Methanophaga sp. ANME-1 ERB7 TaxID=2759913 RepID=A0A7G9Z9B0_9EURY|nr:hypothetical protein IPLBMFHP_00030 [Methanosarcinales archaeon ANME-1 ERB7]